jgi:16S rRNA (cytosine967-C5)-methyltransferase
VQDEGSQVVALAVADTPTTEPDRGAWLDLCAGPGGKAALLGAVLLQRRTAGDLPAEAQLLATEVAPHRADLMRTGVAAVNRAAISASPTPHRDHAGIHMDSCMITGESGGTPGVGAAGSADRVRGRPAVRVEVADGRQLEQLLGDGAHEAFDRVLLDAPCTGLGALRRRPEARWRRRPADLAALGPLQRQLLRAALDAVRPGGVVGYVTCSPHPAETTLVVDDVLRRDRYGAVVERVGADRQLWPHVHGTDAMYLAVLRRVRSGRP